MGPMFRELKDQLNDSVIFDASTALSERSISLAAPRALERRSLVTLRCLQTFHFIGPEFKSLFNRDPLSLYSNPRSILAYVHPEDQDLVSSKMDSEDAGEAGEYRFRILRPSGEIRFLHARARPFIDTATSQSRIATVFEDLTPPHLKRLRSVKQTLPSLTPKLTLRRQLEDRVRRWSRRPGSNFFALAFIDFVRFRSINDSIGYAAGDTLLTEFGQRIRSVLSVADSIACFGADRFAVLMGGVDNAEEAETLIRRIQAALAGPYEVENLRLTISSRAGLAFPRSADCSADTMLRDADSAHQQARLLREPLTLAGETSPRETLAQTALEADLSRALENDDFFFEFQPVFDPKSGRVLLLEALVRWRHPRLGVISPASFISLAEDSGLVLNLDLHGLARLGKQLEAWRLENPRIASIPVSINVSGRHFPKFALEERFHELLGQPYLRDARLVFEITESVFVEGNARTVAGLQRLRQAGVQIWLDDFGEGYSSFRYLSYLPIDGIKISECFVRSCASDARSRLILSSLQNLGRGMGVRVVAEGVETKEQFETLRNMGFDHLQGYYLARPLAASAIPSLLSDLHSRPFILPRTA